MDEAKTIKDKLHDVTGLSYSFIDSKFEVLNNEEITDTEKESFYTDLSWMIPSGIVNTDSKKEILKSFREENNLPPMEDNSELDIYEEPTENDESTKDEDPIEDEESVDDEPEEDGESKDENDKVEEVEE